MLMILFDADAATFDAADILPCHAYDAAAAAAFAAIAPSSPPIRRFSPSPTLFHFSFRQRQLYALIFSLFAAMPIDTPLAATRLRAYFRFSPFSPPLFADIASLLPPERFCHLHAIASSSSFGQDC
jgi:hypothetical protein